MEAIKHIRDKIPSATILLALFFAIGMPLHANVSISPVSVNFSNQSVGTTSAAAHMTLTNAKQRKATIVSISSSVPQFSYSWPSLPFTLGPGQQLTGTVAFTPAAQQRYNGTLTFTAANGLNIVVSLSGTGVQALPLATIQPTSETVTAGHTATFSAAATGTAPLSYQWMKNGTPISGATSSIYTTPATTTSNTGSQFTITVSNSAGNVTSNAAILTVNASAPAQLTANLSSLNFGNVNMGSNGSLNVILTNSGNSIVTISNVGISGPGFNVSGASGSILSPTQSETLNATFTPGGAGGSSGSITISSNAVNSPLKVDLSGTGVQPQITSITVTPANQTAPSGTQVQFKAVDNFGNDITSSVVWSSSDPSIVSITADGLATGIVDGSVTIMASE